MSAVVAFALAAAVHAGFQATVTLLVYPALVEVDRGAWDVAHARHTRRITSLVALLYAALVATGALLVVRGPEALGWAALAATAAALATTALGAAPIHGRMRAEDDDLRRRLLLVDRVRCAFAVLGAVLAVAAVPGAG